MKIKSMTATFGKLENARLEPGPGLTIIHAPNEGGKSTWAAFWKAMLYGIDTRDRDRKGYIADKNRWQPWSGAPMAGELSLEWQGRDITIRRGPRGSVPFGSFSAVYTGTEEPVPGLTGANCGEMLTGAGREVFERSAFLGSGGLTLTSAPELERRIAALVTSGEEDISFSQAMARLKEWRNKRQVNRSVGEIPRLEGELAQIRVDLASLEEVTADLAQLEREQNTLTRQRNELLDEENIHRRIACHDLNRRYALAHQELETARQQLALLEQEGAKFGPRPNLELVKKAQGELQYLKVLDEEIKAGREALNRAEEDYIHAQEAAHDERFAGQTTDEAAETVRRAIADYTMGIETAKTKATAARIFPLLGLLALAAAAVIGWLQEGLFLSSALKIGFLALGLTLLIAVINRSEVKSWRERSTKVLSRFHVQTPDELEQHLADYRARQQAVDQAAQERKTIRGTLSDRTARRENSWSDLIAFVHTFAPEVQNEFGCSAALSRALSIDHELTAAKDRVDERQRRLDDLAAQGGQLADTLELLHTPERSPQETAQALTQTAARLEQVNAQLNQAQGRQRAMGDPAALAARQEELESALFQRKLELNALETAMTILTQANTQLQERFSPELNRLAGQYMARLTRSKYAAVSLTRELEGFVQSGDEVLPRSALCLSKGTADQLYLAVRLAVCQLCLPEKPPILLDDALISFDDDRLGLALELLRELAEEQQLLLFTCQKRERAALSGIPGVDQRTLQ